MIRWLALLALLFMPTRAHAHVGGLDAYGCHNNSAAKVYECHKGQFAGQTFTSKDAMLAKLNETKLTPALTAGDAKLTWNASENALGYKVYVGTASGKYCIAFVIGNVTSFDFSTLAKGPTYYFAVTAFNNDGESTFSNEVSKTL